MWKETFYPGSKPLKSKETRSHLGRFLTSCSCLPPAELPKQSSLCGGVSKDSLLRQIEMRCLDRLNSGVLRLSSCLGGKEDIQGGLRCMQSDEMPSNSLKLNICPRNGLRGVRFWAQLFDSFFLFKGDSCRVWLLLEHRLRNWRPCHSAVLPCWVALGPYIPLGASVHMCCDICSIRSYPMAFVVSLQF